MPLQHAVSKLGKTYHVKVRRARPVLREMGIVLLCFPSLQVKEIHSFSDQMVRNCMHNLACLLLGTEQLSWSAEDGNDGLGYNNHCIACINRSSTVLMGSWRKTETHSQLILCYFWGHQKTVWFGSLSTTLWLKQVRQLTFKKVPLSLIK